MSIWFSIASTYQMGSPIVSRIGSPTTGEQLADEDRECRMSTCGNNWSPSWKGTKSTAVGYAATADIQKTSLWTTWSTQSRNRHCNRSQVLHTRHRVKFFFVSHANLFHRSMFRDPHPCLKYLPSALQTVRPMRACAMKHHFRGNSLLLRPLSPPLAVPAFLMTSQRQLSEGFSCC